MDEAKILESIRCGDIGAFTTIIERYQLPLTGYLYRLTGNWETAKDLAQDTFIQAYKSIPNTYFRSSFKAWLYKVATNAGKKFLQHNNHAVDISVEMIARGKIRAGAWNPGNVIEDMHIRETLLRVKKERRVSLLLHFWEGLTYREIAGIVGASEEAVRKRVSRGCREFREHYERRGESEDEVR